MNTLILTLTFVAPLLQDPAPVAAPPVPGDTQAAGLSREEMWRAPTAEDWAMPVLIPFQRSWEDALAVSRETGKPILACINMDGEIASEHYAGVRYRQPEVAALYEPFVNVVASVYRHTPRDFDVDGNRILCPRFGSVTCGEHIALEPILYGLYLDEERVAPRHIVIELDGSESKDVYYANDTASVFQTLREAAAGRPAPLEPRRTDGPWSERLMSAELADRAAVEAAFQAGNLDTKRKILNTALAAGGPEHHQLWRLALHSGQPELARLAVQGLVASTSPAAIDLILDSLRGIESPDDQEVLVGTLERIGASSERARQLVVSFRGFAGRSDSVDGAAAGAALAKNGGVERDGAVGRLVRLDGEVPIGSGAYGQPGGDEVSAADTLSQAKLALERASAELELAVSPASDLRFLALYLEDASRSLEAARPVADSPDAWRWELVDIAFDLAAAKGPVGRQEAEDRAALLVPTLSPEAIAGGGALLRDVLAAFVWSRERAIRDAVRNKAEWPSSFMADAKEGFAAIATAPGTRAEEFVAHQDFLRFMGAFSAADQVLEAGLERYLVDPSIHDRLRSRLLWDKRLDAMDGLEGRYESLLAAPDAPARLSWYAGYASRTAAEVLRRSGQPARASEAYGRALAHFQDSAAGDPTTLASSDFQRALCISGQARIAFEAGAKAEAAELLIASLELAPESAATLDGLNQSAVISAQLVAADLGPEAGGALFAALERLRLFYPRLFDPPSFERNSIGRRPVGFGGRRFSGMR